MRAVNHLLEPATATSRSGAFSECRVGVARCRPPCVHPQFCCSAAPMASNQHAPDSVTVIWVLVAGRPPAM